MLSCDPHQLGQLDERPPLPQQKRTHEPRSLLWAWGEARRLRRMHGPVPLRRKTGEEAMTKGRGRWVQNEGTGSESVFRCSTGPGTAGTAGTALPLSRSPQVEGGRRTLGAEGGDARKAVRLSSRASFWLARLKHNLIALSILAVYTHPLGFFSCSSFHQATTWVVFEKHNFDNIETIVETL